MTIRLTPTGRESGPGAAGRVSDGRLRKGRWLRKGQWSSWMVEVAVGGMFWAAAMGIVTPVRAQEELSAESPSLSSPGRAPAPTVRSLLEAFGYLIDDWRPFQDGDPLTADRRSDWGKFLQRLGRCDAAELASLARGPTAEGWFVGDWQGTAWQLQGRVRRVRRVVLDREEAVRYGMAELAELEMAVDGAGTGPAVVVTSRIPASWRADWSGEFDEPVRMVGVLMQRGGAGEPVFATQGLAWFPARPQPARGVTSNIVWLARHGVDIAAWQAIAPHGSLAYLDRLPFYQTLAAVRSLETATDGRPRARTDWDIAQWLQDPAGERGEFYELTGTARRAIAIEVTDPEMRARHGLDRYYEVEVFVSLPHSLRLVPPRPPAVDAIGSVPNEPVREPVVPPPGGPRGAGVPVTDEVVKSWSTYPVVYCCPELPAGFRTGENIHESVRLAGFYFKLWSYHAQVTMSGQRTDDSAAAGRQASPLLVGNSIVVVPPMSPGSGRLSTPLVLFLFGLLLVLLTAIPWWWARSDRAAAERLRRWRQRHPPSGLD